MSPFITESDGTLCFASSPFTRGLRLPEKSIKCSDLCERRNIQPLYYTGHVWKRRVVFATTASTIENNSGSTTNKALRDRNSKGKSPVSEEEEHGVVVRRDAVESTVRRSKSLKIRRWTTLRELKMVEDLDDMLIMTEDKDKLQNRRVNVWLVVQKLQQDYRVLGRTETHVECVCDRCAQEFEVVSDGRFEVVLLKEVTPEAEAEYEEVAEAIDSFDQDGNDEVNLEKHVRDAVLLGLPSRTLCSPDCTGVDMSQNQSGESAGTVTYALDN